MDAASNYLPMRFARSLLKLAKQRNFNIQQIILNAQLDVDPFNAAAPEHISAIQYSRLYQQVLNLLQDDSFGMPQGKGVSPGAFRMMCYAIINCENLNSAIKRLCEFFEVFYDSYLHVSLTVEGGKATLSYPKYKAPIDARWQAGEAYGLALWHRFFTWLVAMPIEVSAVRLVSEQAHEKQQFKQLFGVAAEFSCEQNGFDFHASQLELPIAQTEESLKDFLRTAPYHMMVSPLQAEPDSLVAQVRRIMGYDLARGFPGFEEVADKLNMSAPTLRRQLRKKGYSYQQLKDQAREDSAIAYLSRPELSVNAISTLMGFTDTSAFHRSFKKWTGLTPGQYRAKHLGIDANLA